MHGSTETYSSLAEARVYQTSSSALKALRVLPEAPPHYQQTQLQVWALWSMRRGFKHDETKSIWTCVWSWTGVRIWRDPLGPLKAASTADSYVKYCFTDFLKWKAQELRPVRDVSFTAGKKKNCCEDFSDLSDDRGVQLYSSVITHLFWTWSCVMSIRSNCIVCSERCDKAPAGSKSSSHFCLSDSSCGWKQSQPKSSKYLFFRDLKWSWAKWTKRLLFLQF